MTTHGAYGKGRNIWFFFALVSTGKACFRFRCVPASSLRELPEMREKCVWNFRVQSSELTMGQHCLPLPVTALASRRSLTTGLRLLCPFLTEVKWRMQGTVGSSDFPHSPKQSWSTRCMCFLNLSLVHKGKDDEQSAESYRAKFLFAWGVCLLGWNGWLGAQRKSHEFSDQI